MSSACASVCFFLGVCSSLFVVCFMVFLLLLFCSFCFYCSFVFVLLIACFNHLFLWHTLWIFFLWKVLHQINVIVMQYCYQAALLCTDRLKPVVRQKVVPFILVGISCRCYPVRKQVLVKEFISPTASSPQHPHRPRNKQMLWDASSLTQSQNRTDLFVSLIWWQLSVPEEQSAASDWPTAAAISSSGLVSEWERLLEHGICIPPPPPPLHPPSSILLPPSYPVIPHIPAHGAEAQSGALNSPSLCWVCKSLHPSVAGHLCVCVLLSLWGPV